MKHNRLVINAESRYYGRLCPVKRQPLNVEDAVVVCPKDDTAISEMVFDEQGQNPICPNCREEVTLLGKTALVKPLPVKSPLVEPSPVKPPPPPLGYQNNYPPQPTYQSTRSPLTSVALVAGGASLAVMLGVLGVLFASGIFQIATPAPPPSVSANREIIATSASVTIAETPTTISQEATVVEVALATQPPTAVELPTSVLPTSLPPQQNTVAPPIIRSRDAWEARVPEGGMVAQKPVRIVLTHEEGSECCDTIDVATRIRSNERIHRERGWPDIAYHFIITPYGEAYEGRSSQYRADSSYAAKNPGYSLDDTIVVGVLGNYNVQEPTAASIDTVNQLLAWLCQQYNLSPEDIYYLRDLAPIHVDPTQGNTTSPGENMPSRQQIRDSVGKLLYNQ